MPHLMIFGITRLQDMIEKGNLWYVRHYSSYFSKVTVVYLTGSYEPKLRNGDVCLVSVGSSRATFIDIFFAPFRLYRIAREKPAEVYLTADQWYSWWSSMLIRALLGGKVVLMPVCIPEQLYRDRGITVSGLPRWLERIFIRLSFWCASYVYTAHAFGDYVRWLSNEPMARTKLVVTPGIVEALPSDEFFQGVRAVRKREVDRREFRLVYVGRLHQEKLVDDLIRVLRLVDATDIKLVLVGDGPERERLMHLAIELGVDHAVDFRGQVSQRELPSLLAQCDAFVSTLTGTSLREAAIIGLPVIAYDRDWIRGLLIDGHHALLVPSGDIYSFATAVIRVRQDKVLRQKLAAGIGELARELWSVETAKQSLQTLHHIVQGNDGRVGPAHRLRNASAG